MASTSLSQRISQGLAVDTLLGLVLRVLSIAVSVAVARLLTETDYGAVSLALAIFGITETLTDLSLGTALIRRPDVARELVDVAWTAQVARGLALAIFVLGLSPSLTRLFGHPEVTSYLQILAFGPLAAAVGNLHVFRFQKQLRFATAFLLENLKFIFGTTSSLILLLATGEAVSLAIGPVAGNLLASATTWLTVSPRPRIRFSRSHSADLFVFSRWLMAQNILVYLFSTLDNLLVGKLLGLAALGVYAFAWRIVNTVMTFLTRSLARMLIPVYASLQGDRAALINTARGALSVAATVGGLAAGTLLIVAPDLFLLLGGGSFIDAVPVARALTLFTFSRMVHNVLAALYYGAGPPAFLTLTAALQLLLLVPGVIIGAAHSGTTGVAVAVALVSSARTLLTMCAAQRHFGLRAQHQLVALVPIATAAVPACLAAVPLSAIPGPPSLRVALVGVTSGGLFLVLWELTRALLGKHWPPLAMPAASTLRGSLARVGRVIGR